MILYHGTNDQKIFEAILYGGFKAGTYFTPFLDSALIYGGCFILAIGEPQVRPSNPWEIVMQDAIPPERILFAHKYDCSLMYLSVDGLIKNKREVLATEGKVMCENCQGRGEMCDDNLAFRYLKNIGGGAWKTRMGSIEVCPICKGLGFSLAKKEQK